MLLDLKRCLKAQLHTEMFNSIEKVLRYLSTKLQQYTVIDGPSVDQRIHNHQLHNTTGVKVCLLYKVVNITSTPTTVDGVSHKVAGFRLTKLIGPNVINNLFRLFSSPLSLNH